MDAIQIVTSFDQYLLSQNLSFEAVVIGGAALNLLGVVSRETRDCDILDPKIPDEILNAANEFQKNHAQLESNWLNNGPESLKKNLPDGWKNRLQILFQGKAILFYTLARVDLLKTKLFAYCDRGFDLIDCIALKPTKSELNDALIWVQSQDINPLWPEHVKLKFLELEKKLGYEL